MKNTNWSFLSEELLAFVTEQGFRAPSPVQEKVWSPIVDGESISVLAQTGSGKTLAYALPLIDLIKKEEREAVGSDEIPQAAPVALIFCPTKELVRQVSAVLKTVTHHAKCRVRALVADRSMRGETMDIVVTTPGKAMNALRKKELSLIRCKSFVLDEADQLLDAHFIKELAPVWKEWLKVVPNVPHPVALFSATMPPDYNVFRTELFGDLGFRDFIFDGGHQVQKNIETVNIFVSGREKDIALEEFIVKRGGGKGIVFFNRKNDVIDKGRFLVEKFKDKKIYLLHGEMGAKDRESVLKAFKSKNAILLASDIAARGLDITGLNWVVNYDLPKDAVYYIHRCGRVGRHELVGYVFNLIGSRDEKLIASVNDAIKNQSLLKLRPLRANFRKESATSIAKKEAIAKKTTTRKEAKKESFLKGRKKVVKRKSAHARKKTKAQGMSSSVSKAPVRKKNSVRKTTKQVKR